GRPPGAHDLDDVGDHVARALDQDRVAHADVLPADLVLVVKAHVADRHAGQLHGRELGGRRQRARLADVHLDRLDHGRRLARGELERDGPARMVRRRAEPALVIERLHLDHRTVGVPASSRGRLSRANSSRGMNTSPRTSMTGTAARAPRRTIGMDRIVRRLGVMSSPTRPSPRVAPRTKRPASYRSAMPRPSILGSHTYVNAAPGRARLIRASNSRRSSGEVALSSESIAS